MDWNNRVRFEGLRPNVPTMLSEGSVAVEDRGLLSGSRLRELFGFTLSLRSSFLILSLLELVSELSLDCLGLRFV